MNNNEADLRLRKLCEAIAEDYAGELAAKIEGGKLLVEVLPGQ